MEKPVRSKKQVTIIKVITLILFFGSFAVMIVSGILKDNGYGDFWWPLVGMVGFFALDLSALALLIIFRKDILTHEIESKEKKADALPLQSLMGLFPGSVQTRLVEHHFKDVGDGFFRKKVFSALKDSICYYAKCFDAIPLKDVFEETMNAVEARNESGSVCLLLFVSKKDVKDSDLESLRDLSKFYLTAETTMPMPVWQACLPILIDSSTNEGRFLDTNGKYPISVYTHGCKFLKRTFL
ncbi:MAG TPA: hypothetical protein VN538_10835 [Clostridia bacterium]|nr:hypothetical protein [Clostridia bacterium]